MSATNLGGIPDSDVRQYLPGALEGPLDLLLLTADPHPESVLPSLSLLAHTVRTAPTEVSSLLEAGSADVAIVDARTDLAAARGLCRLLGTTGTSVPVVAVVNEGGLVAVNVDWGLDEILLPEHRARRDRRPAAAAGRPPRRRGRTRRTRARSASASSSSTRAPTPPGCAAARSTSPTRSSSC